MGAVVLLGFILLSCSLTASQLMARRSSTTATPTRTPRPTWTPAAGGLMVASPTVDLTRFPNAALPTAELPAATPQVVVPGAPQGIVVPPSDGVQAVQTVVIILVTATPQAAIPPRPLGPTFTPGPTSTPGPPTATPLPTTTPPPPVLIHVKTDNANVRQGPGNTYPLVTRLEQDTTVTIVGRNREGDWWKICCVNGSDVWIADSVVSVEGPLWTVAEVTNIAPPPPPTPTLMPTITPVPTPTYAWGFRLEGPPQEYPHDQNYFKVDAVIYNGSTPLWGYKLKIRKLSTGGEWISEPSQTTYRCERLHYPLRQQCFAPDQKFNVKWDSNSISVPMGDDAWEVVVVDGGGKEISAPVRLNTSASSSKWYYLTFTSKP